MAGLVAAARLRQLGREAVVLEKGTRAGGSMVLSSCMMWRHRELEAFRADCPAGDPALQALVWERLDDALRWLESLGAPVVARDTGNPLTTGVRFEPRGLAEALVQAAGGVRLSTPLGEPDGEVVLATGGFGVRLASERGLAVRAARWSEGDGLAFALARGAALTPGQDEFYGRAMPAPPARWGEADFVRAAQLYGRFARLVDDEGRPLFAGEPAWHENDLAQALARVPSAWLVVEDDLLGARVRERTVADMVRVAEELGGEVRREGGTTAVRVRAGVTHTIGGLRVDERARVVDESGAPVPGLHAAGADAGGIFTGGYGSGLAAALVLGLAAADDLAAA
jgi:succinate dehydrogenase/fumarate reductase flavoprotein subunit